jgi:nicotinate-nucleotide adenylyltransferase
MTLPRAANGLGPVGILGGTFDPIHFGHLRTALELLERLELAEVRFVPCREPPHRHAPPRVADMRLDMVRAAVEGESRFRVDDRELRRDGPSYTVDTLASLREEFPAQSLCLLLGMDAFLGLPKWHRWTELLSYAHVVVAHRPGWVAPCDGPLGALLDRHRTAHATDVHDSTGGCIVVTPVTQLEISSTNLRSALVLGKDPRYLVPDRVREIILSSGCYR